MESIKMYNGMERIKEDISCFLFGKCTRYKYEYTFMYNGETIKTEDCSQYAFGRTECRYEDTIYNNVNYSKKFLGKQDYVGFPFFPIIFTIILAWFFEKLFMSAIRI